jgi:hypothetical protein
MPKTTQSLRARAGKRRQGRPSVAEFKAAQTRFLEAYAKTGTILAAAKIAGIDRRSHTRWMHDEKYVERFKVAGEESAETLLGEMRRRALLGHEEPVIFKGQPVMIPDPNNPGQKKIFTVRRPSDRLLEKLVESEFPGKFRERYEHEIAGPQGGPITLRVVYQEAEIKNPNALSRLKS